MRLAMPDPRAYRTATLALLSVRSPEGFTGEDHASRHQRADPLSGHHDADGLDSTDR